MAFWRPYVPVAKRREKAQKAMKKLEKAGKIIRPVVLEGKKIAASFWGKGWCDHLEGFSDYENRLPRGRTYVRNGSVCHLEVKEGLIEAMVNGSELYTIKISIAPLSAAKWKAIKKKCRGHIGSMLELLQGKLSSQIMAVVTDRREGLFPLEKEIKLQCSCPDWATMCKHVAAVLYGVGSRLDEAPELLFLLRGVDVSELITAPLEVPAAAASAIDTAALSDIFGIDLDAGDAPLITPSVETAKPQKSRAKAKKAPAAAPPVASKSAAKSSVKKAGAPAKAKASVKPVKGRRIFRATAPTGAAIRRLRRKAGLTFATFAEALDVSVPSVKRWEETPGTLRLQEKTVRKIVAFEETMDS